VVTSPAAATFPQTTDLVAGVLSVSPLRSEKTLFKTALGPAEHFIERGRRRVEAAIEDCLGAVVCGSAIGDVAGSRRLSNLKVS
jgi:hypothetical protein